MKKTLMILGSILLVLAVAAGSFWGGMAYQTRRAEEIRARFYASRGMGGGTAGSSENNGGQFPGGGLGQGFSRGGGTAGEVKSIDGNVITLSTAQDTTRVVLSDSTQIQKNEAGSLADLQPGMRVVVTGEKDSSGEIAAGQIRILSTNTQVGGPYPAPAGP